MSPCSVNHFNIQSGDTCPMCGKSVTRDERGREINPPETAVDFCDSCGHSDLDHITEDDNAYCLGGKGCRCSEFRPKARGITCVMITQGTFIAPGEEEYEEKA